MKRFAVLLAIVLMFRGVVALSGVECASEASGNPTPLSWAANLPVYDHVVIVVEENKDYDQIIGKTDDASYINKVLHDEGASFKQMFGEEHNSEGNYFWLFSGSNQCVGFTDKMPAVQLKTANLGQALIGKNLSFKGYAESLPEIGSLVERKGAYARKHVPWISFDNLPNLEPGQKSSNLRFDDFPANFKDLPTVAFVIPNLQNDMHDGTIKEGDTWLKDKLDPYYQWAKENNSLLIVTFDENDTHMTGFTGLTDPFHQGSALLDQVTRNQIATIFAGAHIKAGEYDEGKGITHVNILRTLEAMYGLPRSGAQQDKAAAGGITDDYVIADVFETVK